MKSLAQYLTEYLETEIEREWDGDMSQLGGWIKEGLEAYQSTEDCKITVTANALQCEDNYGSRCSKRDCIHWWSMCSAQRCDECLAENYRHFESKG